MTSGTAGGAENWIARKGRKGYEESVMAEIHEQDQKLQRGIAEGAAADGPHEGAVLLHRYRLDAVLYRSGWGDFWLAEDLGEGAEDGADDVAEELPPVRILALRRDVRRSKRTLRALRDSVAKASRLHFNGLSAARQLFTVGEQYYVLCDPIEGYPLSIVLAHSAEHGRPYEEATRLAASLAQVLDYAHERGVVNANIRPGAVSVWEDGSLADLAGFGIRADLGGGRRTVLGDAREGSGKWLGYLAPEIVSRQWTEDDASDQYALAALMWQVVFGEPPPAGGDPVPPAGAKERLPARALEALRRGLSRKRSARFASCADFARAFGGERVLRRRGIGVMERRAFWRRVGMVALVVLAIGLAAGLAAGIVYGVKLLHDHQGGRVVVHDVAPAAAGGPITEVTVEVEEAAALTDCTETLEEGRNYRALDGMEFVWVPTMHCWVGRFEVTNREYREMEPEHDSGEYEGLTLNEDEQPVVRVRFKEAVAFAAWFDRREHEAGRIPAGYEVRLPETREFVRYAQAGTDREYPWGSRLPPRFGNYADAVLKEQTSGPVQVLENYRDGFVATCPVKASGENDWGLFGVGGNVWETTVKPGDHEAFGGWFGGGFDTGDPTRITTMASYGYLGNARGAVNGIRLVIVPPAATTGGGES